MMMTKQGTLLAGVVCDLINTLEEMNVQRAPANPSFETESKFACSAALHQCCMWVYAGSACACSKIKSKSK